MFVVDAPKALGSKTALMVITEIESESMDKKTRITAKDQPFVCQIGFKREIVSRIVICGILLGIIGTVEP